MLGNFRIRIRDGTEQTISPIQIIRYWNHSHSAPQDDLMLIRLAKPAILNEKVQPIALATSTVKPGTICMLSGLDWSQNNNGECTCPQTSGCQLYLMRQVGEEPHVCVTESRGGWRGDKGHSSENTLNTMSEMSTSQVRHPDDGSIN